MKTYTLTLLGMFSATTVVAADINESMDAAEDGTVSISNVAGSVDVQGWSRNQVEITGDLGDDVEELVFERDGDEIEIKVRTKRRNSHDIDTELVIKVPQASSLEISTVSADIDVAEVAGEQSLESVSSDIATEAYASDIDANSVSGDVDPQTGYVADLGTIKEIVESEVITLLDHKNLNLDVEQFRGVNPTAENIVVVIWKLLEGKLPSDLTKIVLWETPRNYVEYTGD